MTRRGASGAAAAIGASEARKTTGPTNGNRGNRGDRGKRADRECAASWNHIGMKLSMWVRIGSPETENKFKHSGVFVMVANCL